MTQKAQMWSNSINSVFIGVLLYSIAGAIYPIFSFFKSFTKLASALQGKVDTTPIAIITYLLLAAIIFGYYLYLKGLTDFEKVTEPADSKNVKSLRTATILVLIGWGLVFLFGFVPFAGWVGKWIGGILNIVAYILMLLAFSGLKTSSTFPTVARAGAGMLFVAMILLLCAAVLNWIPFIGGILNIIISVVAFIMVIMGWLKIKSASAEVA
ncbi:MAG: hypothetical protein LBH22_04845 [Bacteroidales bacterium]|jgi:hypothetical protein|nr:hypothetical protein [Bacteroidales bacterium]